MVLAECIDCLSLHQDDFTKICTQNKPQNAKEINRSVRCL